MACFIIQCSPKPLFLSALSINSVRSVTHPARSRIASAHLIRSAGAGSVSDNLKNSTDIDSLAKKLDSLSKNTSYSKAPRNIRFTKLLDDPRVKTYVDKEMPWASREELFVQNPGLSSDVITTIHPKAEGLFAILKELAKEAGFTEDELNTIADKFMRSMGGSPSCLGFEGYPKGICISINDEVVHGIPGNRKIKNVQGTSPKGLTCSGLKTPSAILARLLSLAGQNPGKRWMRNPRCRSPRCMPASGCWRIL